MKTSFKIKPKLSRILKFHLEYTFFPSFLVPSFFPVLSKRRKLVFSIDSFPPLPKKKRKKNHRKFPFIKKALHFKNNIFHDHSNKKCESKNPFSLLFSFYLSISSLNIIFIINSRDQSTKGDLHTNTR